MSVMVNERLPELKFIGCKRMAPTTRKFLLNHIANIKYQKLKLRYYIVKNFDVGSLLLEYRLLTKK